MLHYDIENVLSYENNHGKLVPRNQRSRGRKGKPVDFQKLLTENHLEKPPIGDLMFLYGSLLSSHVEYEL